jgi:translation initiation factor 3 subunit B
MSTIAPITPREIKEFNPNEEFEYPEPPFKLDTNLDNVIAIDNLPITEESKADKMIKLIEKILKKYEVKPVEFYMPIDKKTGKTKGFVFAELATADDSKKALERVQGYAFTSKNLFKVYNVGEWERYEKFDENNIQPPVIEPYKEQEDLNNWLLDEQARDQYALHYHDTVQIMWNDPHHKAVSVHRRENWSENGIMWSPQGHYLVTFHKKGIALWGGENWKTQSSFAHKNARLCHFSPNEKYVVTMNEDPVNNVIVWDVKSKKKEFFTADDSIARLPDGRWPVFHWSHDSKYFARLGKRENELEIYEAATFKLLGGKPLEIDGIQSFSWCPNKNIIAYWTPDRNSVPSKIALLEVPKYREIRAKNFFGVLNIQMFWHPDGDFLAAAIDSEVTKKSTKVVQTSLELFRMNQKGIPIETQEVKDTLSSLAWEPKGVRFAIIHGSQPIKKDVSIYTMEGPNQSCKLLKTLESRQVDTLLWSPRGINLVISNTKSSTATLEFWDVNELDVIGYGEHFGMTNALWDPTGRYLCTYVSAHKRAADLGFIIWTFLGRVLHRVNLDLLYEFLWRPRPPSLLTPGQEKKIRKNLKQNLKKLEEEVREQDERVKEQIRKERQRQFDQFMEFMERIKQEYEEMKQERYALRGYASDEEEVVEEVVEQWEEEVQ